MREKKSKSKEVTSSLSLKQIEKYPSLKCVGGANKEKVFLRHFLSDLSRALYSAGCGGNFSLIFCGSAKGSNYTKGITLGKAISRDNNRYLEIFGQYGDNGTRYKYMISVPGFPTFFKERLEKACAEIFVPKMLKARRDKAPASPVCTGTNTKEPATATSEVDTTPSAGEIVADDDGKKSSIFRLTRDDYDLVILVLKGEMTPDGRVPRARVIELFKELGCKKVNSPIGVLKRRGVLCDADKQHYVFNTLDFNEEQEDRSASSAPEVLRGLEAPHEGSLAQKIIALEQDVKSAPARRKEIEKEIESVDAQRSSMKREIQTLLENLRLLDEKEQALQVELKYLSSKHEALEQIQSFLSD